MSNFIQEDQFVGKQIIIDSDRLVFNSRGDNIFSSKDLFLFKTDGKFHVNGSNDIKLNSPTVYIGPIENGQDVNIPAVRSRELKLLLGDLIGALEVFFSIQYPNTSGLMGPNLSVNLGLAQTILNDLASIKTRLDDIDSKNVFIK